MSMIEVAVPFTVSSARAAAGALTLLLLATASAEAGAWQATGSLIDVSVEIEGAAAPLYPARDGSGRYYLEAHAGGSYAVRIANRCSERIGIVVAVDGLNAISGEREPGPSASARPGRMYVVDPWDEVRVRGWRTSLHDVRQFTFVDERASYASRTGRSNSKMGWIQAWVYRERSGARVSPPRHEPWDRRSYPEGGTEERGREGATTGRSDPSAEADKAPPAAAAPPADKAERAEGRTADGALRTLPPRESAESFPGTGWGSQAWDPATVVSFVPQRRPSDVVTVRYEYAPALRALGLLPRFPDRDRLRERDRGDGFARPPAW
jgi:hypothetical protein